MSSPSAASRAERRDLELNALTYTISLSEVVISSLRYEMLLAKRQDIQKIIESIGTTDFIEKVRIVDETGRIFYSSQPEEINQVHQMETFLVPLARENHVKTETAGSRWGIYPNSQGRVLAYLAPIENTPDCYTAACHVHPPDRKTLGFLRTDFSLQDIDNNMAEHSLRNLFYIICFVGLIALLLSVTLWKLVIAPLTGLARGMRQVSAGDLAPKLDVPSMDEIGALAATFNTMTSELSDARQKMERWNQRLAEEVDLKAREIRQTQDKLIEAEKMAALGRLTADIAHSIRNPLTALGGFGRRLLKLASTEKQQEYAKIVVSEAARLEHILRDVLVYSREPEYHYQKMPVTEVLKESLRLFADIFNEHAIRVELVLDTELPILLEKDQARQAIDNLLSNAADAMPEGGILSIQVRAADHNNITYVAVTLADTGSGVQKDKLAYILEPFYSTKKVGRGTGLGLPISRKIIEEHGGFMSAANRPEGGFAITLYFPYQEEKEQARPCWEFMQCGRDKNNETKCPAYPHFGRVCWAVAGTLCAGKVQGTFAQKYSSCTVCKFYNHVMQKRKAVE